MNVSACVCGVRARRALEFEGGGGTSRLRDNKHTAAPQRFDFYLLHYFISSSHHPRLLEGISINAARHRASHRTPAYIYPTGRQSSEATSRAFFPTIAHCSTRATHRQDGQVSAPRRSSGRAVQEEETAAAEIPEKTTILLRRFLECPRIPTPSSSTTTTTTTQLTQQ